MVISQQFISKKEYTMKQPTGDDDFFLILLDEHILAIDEKVYGQTIGELMKLHRGIQFACGTMFFKDDDAAKIMTMPPDEAKQNKINGMEILRNGYAVLTMDRRAFPDECHRTMDFVIHFLTKDEKAGPAKVKKVKVKKPTD